MKVTFLESKTPLTKSYKLNKDNSITKTSYPNAYEFTSKTHAAGDLAVFTKLLRQYAATDACLLKGAIQTELKNESRAGSTDSNTPTTWACLDIDGLEQVKDPNAFMKLIGFDKLSYIIQWSASYGINDKHLRCHIFIELDKDYKPDELKRWLTHLNLSVPELKQELRLTKNNMALHWPLDISACQNDKLLYIAAPKLSGITDPCKHRIQLVSKQEHKAVIDLNTIPYKPELQTKTANHVNELRKAAGFKAKTQKYKFAGDVEYLTNPDQLSITGQRIERGFVYFNLNGGDSWAYYHPENNPEFIYNFKNEPAYRTEDLLPEYWKTVKHQVSKPAQLAGPDLSKATLKGIQYFAFRDGPTSRYFTAQYDPNNNGIALEQVKNETQVKHYLDEHDQPSDGFIPRWEIVYDPTNFTCVDIPKQTINMFTPSTFMKQQKHPKVLKVPPTIYRLVHHVFGNDQQTTEHWINHFAYIIQNRGITSTGWLAHGVSGTGKGVLFWCVIQPLLGASNTQQIRMDQLEEPYNDYADRSLYVMVDEIQTSASLYNSKLMQRIKNQISEQNIQIRRMYSMPVKRPNFANYFFASNMPDPIEIRKDDRRFNVGYYQSNPIALTAADIGKIKSELDDFYAYLIHYQVDTQKARTPLLNAARTQMQLTSQQSLDGICDALLSGNLISLVESIVPLSHDDILSADYTNRKKYDELIRRIIHTMPDRLTREEIQLIVEHCVGGAPRSPYKFTAMMRHHNVYIEPHSFNGLSQRGIKVEWKIDAKSLMQLRKDFELPTKPSLKVVK